MNKIKIQDKEYHISFSNYLANTIQDVKIISIYRARDKVFRKSSNKIWRDEKGKPRLPILSTSDRDIFNACDTELSLISMFPEMFSEVASEHRAHFGNLNAASAEHFHLLDFTEETLKDIAKLQTKDVILEQYSIKSKLINDFDGEKSEQLFAELRDEYFLPELQKLRRQQRRIREEVCVACGIVGMRGDHSRVSTVSREYRRLANKMVDEFVKKTVLYNKKTRVKFQLPSYSESLRHRSSEIYAIAKGIQKRSEAEGLNWASVVVSLPGAMHALPKYKRKAHRWDGTTPHECVRILQVNWELCRAYLQKHSIQLKGLWTREAHLDGTPHQNFLIYFKKGDAEFIEQAFRKYFGESEEAVRWQLGKESTDKNAASFASYALKYFTKFLGDYKSNELSDEQLSEQAWASVHGFRRVGFFGLPSIGMWRRLRAQRDEPTSVGKEIQMLWSTANPAEEFNSEGLNISKPDFSAFIELCGGFYMLRNERPFRLITELSATGKSKIAVGVAHMRKDKLTDELFEHSVLKNKWIGDWEIKACATERAANAFIQEVTVSLNYPRKSKALNSIADYRQKSFENRRLRPPQTLH